jgi:hypothetical protein
MKVEIKNYRTGRIIAKHGRLLLARHWLGWPLAQWGESDADIAHSFALGMADGDGAAAQSHTQHTDMSFGVFSSKKQTRDNRKEGIFTNLDI